MRVVIAPYDPRWRADFERIRGELASALVGVDVLAVEHVGSTSVPGLPAKPVIDIDVVVDARTIPRAIAALESAGYVHEGDRGVPERHAFRAPDDEPRRNVYVCLDGCLALRNHLAVRETLRSNPGLRDEYARVKSALADQDLATMDQSVAGKNAVLGKILEAAGLSPDELEAVAAAN